MQGKIGLEEHFAIATRSRIPRVSADAVWPELEERLLDIQDKRLRRWTSTAWRS